MLTVRNRLASKVIARCMACVVVLIFFAPQNIFNTLVTYAQNTTTTWDFENGSISDWTTTGQVQIISASIDQLTDGHMTL